MSQVYIVLKIIFSQFWQSGGGVEIEKFNFFQNRKSLCLEIQVVLKFGEERMKITLILFVHVILVGRLLHFSTIHGKISYILSHKALHWTHAFFEHIQGRSG